MKKERNINTPYDDVFRTLLNDCPELIIPVVNEIFKKDYDISEKVILSNNEIFINRQDGDQEKRITDSQFVLQGSHYHVECQSTSDGTMMVRMFEYDAQIALKNSEWNGYHLTVHFPNTAIMCLRQTKKMPDEGVVTIDMGEQGSFTYLVPIMKVQKYSVEEIFEKQLYFLIPFHIFVYEKKFGLYDTDEQKLEELMFTYEDIMLRLVECRRQGIITEYEELSIIGLAKKVLEHLTGKHSNLKKGVGDIMGGKIIDHPAKDILNRGKEIGKIEGSSEGRAASIVRLLKKKGFIVEGFETRIMKEQNLDILDKWLDLAIDATTQEEFEKGIKE